jgi:hypothetical protein
MSKYTPEQFRFPTSLDEIGIDLGLQRLPKETLNAYRRRLLLHSKEPPSPKRKSIVQTPQRKVGLFEKRVLEISLVTDSEGVPLAKDPRLEIKSCEIHVWENWNYGKSDPDYIINTNLKENAYFLKEVYNQLSLIPFLSIEKSLEYEDYLKSYNIKIDDTDVFYRLSVLNGSTFNQLPISNVRSAYFGDPFVFASAVEDLNSMTQPGDYYFDKINGRLFTYSIARGSVEGVYSSFPFNMMWQPVKVFEVNDDTLKEKTRDLLINDEGNLERLLLNSYGAKIANSILIEHPLQWGE